MNKKYRIVALFGKSGAGKDTIQKYLVKHLVNSKGIVSYTTRPKRDYEKDGVDYNFISEYDFMGNIESHKMLEYAEFRKWYYGTCIEGLEIDKINIGVFNLDGINTLLKDDRVTILPIFIDAPAKVRIERSLQREENPDCVEICRRFLADEKDFNKKMNFISLKYDNIKNDITIIEDILINATHEWWS